MSAISRITGTTARDVTQQREETAVQEEIDEMVEAVKFARAHDMQVVVCELDAARGVPFYWRFVPVVR